VQELHSQGYSLLTKDPAGQTMLHYASRYGHKDIVKYIIRYAPSSILNIKDINLGQTALHKAAAYKWRSICCMLVAGGAALDVTDHRGLTPRLLALQSDDHDLAAYFESESLRFEHFDKLGRFIFQVKNISSWYLRVWGLSYEKSNKTMYHSRILY
jgi:diacylglycerol kinase (ATP)